MLMFWSGACFLITGLLVLRKNGKDLKKASYYYNKAYANNAESRKNFDEAIRLTKKFNYLTRTVAERGVLIKKLKTELYKPKPKKAKETKIGVFIRCDRIISCDYNCEQRLLNMTVSDNGDYIKKIITENNKGVSNE